MAVLPLLLLLLLLVVCGDCGGASGSAGGGGEAGTPAPTMTSNDAQTQEEAPHVATQDENKTKENKTKDKKPNIVVFLVDDLGHFNVGFMNNPNATTPHIDQLAREGVILDRHYVFKYCSPSRSSFISGRLPVHVNVENRLIKENGGTDLRMTTLPEKLKSAGYRTFMAGKWHAGGYAFGQVPGQRGFDYSIGYLDGKEDHYTHYMGMLGAYDFWQTNNVSYGYKGIYGDSIYVNKSVEFIHNVTTADKDEPIFMYIAFQNVHEPLQVPPQYEDPSLPKGRRRKYYAMGTFVDSAIANITSALKAAGMWDNTLVLFSSDNGGPTGSGCNYPLRGFKFDCFDGGVKAVSFLSGPVLPSAVKGTRSSALVHIADWYATFASLAKVDPWDNTTAVPPSDGLNVWPALTKEQPSPRTEIVLCEKAILSGRYKLVNEYRYDGYSGPAYPETPITPAPPCPKDGCLFDIERDPRETTDLSDTYPQIKKDLLAKLQNASATFFQTGDDGYKGKFTDCKPFHEILNMTDGYGAPLCYEPKHHPNNIKGK